MGAPRADGGGGPFGRAYLYERNQNGADGWGLVKTLNPAGATGTPRFGCAVALDAHRAVVGARDDTEYGAAVGTLHVYARDAGGWGNWGQIQRLVGQDSVAADYFGAAVAMDGDSVVVGMHGDDPQGENSGTARLLTWSGNRWYFEQRLIHVNPDIPPLGDQYGASVSVKGDRLAAGVSHRRASAVHDKQSTVLVHERSQPGGVQPWRLQKELHGMIECEISPDWAVCRTDGFGMAVGLDAEPLVVGAVSLSSALLLGPDAVIRFVLALNCTGTVLAAIQYRAWDQTSGNGSLANLSPNGGLGLIVLPGGRSAYSERDRWASIEVKELNRPPVDLALDNASVLENQPAGTRVGGLSATDPNAGDTPTFALVAGDGGEDNGSFRIDGRRLYTDAQLDCAAHGSYRVRVQADDGHGGRFQRTFTIVEAEVVNSGVIERRWHVDDVLLVVERPSHPPLVLEVDLTAVAEQLELEWASVPGRQYVIEWCADLGTLRWVPVSGPVMGAAGAATTSVLVDLRTLPGHPQTQLYFRLKAP